MQTIAVTTELTIGELRDTSWGKAPATIKRLTNTEIEIIFFTLEEISEGKPYTRTEINDFFWFEDEQIEELIGKKIIWSDDSAPYEDELEIYRKASTYYEDMIERLKGNYINIDLFNIDKELCVEEYISSKIKFDEYIEEHPFQISNLMLKIFNERW